MSKTISNINFIFWSDYLRECKFFANATFAIQILSLFLFSRILTANFNNKKGAKFQDKE